MFFTSPFSVIRGLIFFNFTSEMSLKLSLAELRGEAEALGLEGDEVGEAGVLGL